MSHEWMQLGERLAKGEKLVTGWISLAEPGLATELIRAGFDCVMLDMQHGQFDFRTAVHAIEAARLAGGAALVRIPVGEFSLASRLLDVGAAGIIAPMINSLEDARRFASFMKFPPLGERSFGPHRAQQAAGLFGQDYLQAANRLHLAIAMIETSEALAALDGILGVEGIDGVLVGPSDLSIALSNGARLDPKGAAVDAKLDVVAAAAKAHKKFACIYCLDGDRVPDLFARGFSLCAPGNDMTLIAAGAKVLLDASRAIAVTKV